MTTKKPTLRDVLGPALSAKAEKINKASAKRQARRPKITYRVIVQPDDLSLLKGSFDFDNEGDNEAEERRIVYRAAVLDDVWAWANVKVEAQIEGLDLVGRSCCSSWLGGCSYKDEADYRRNSGYFLDQCEEALEELRKQLKSGVEHGTEAKKILTSLGE